MLEFFLEYLSLSILVLNVLFGIKIQRTDNRLKWFEATLVTALIVQMVAIPVSKTIGNNMPLLHLYTLVEFIFISLFYKEILAKEIKYGKYFHYFIILLALIIIGNSISIEPLTGFNTNAKGLTQVVIISYAVIYFFNRISIDVTNNNLILNRINSAILLYYSGSLFIFIFANFLKEESLMSQYFWQFNAVLYLTFQILILIATWRIVFPHKVIESEKE